jgi:hypothetical protein
VIKTFDFSEALRLMKRGYRVTRTVCPDDVFLELRGTEIWTDRNTVVEDATVEAILAEDWHLVDAEGGK